MKNGKSIVLEKFEEGRGNSCNSAPSFWENLGPMWAIHHDVIFELLDS